MGFATNQSETSVRIFCYSLRTVYRPAECDIVIITNRHEEYFRELARIGVRFEPTPNNYSPKTPQTTRAIRRGILYGFRFLNNRRTWIPEIADAYRGLLEMSLFPHLARWFAYTRFLSVNKIYQHVCFLDVKDVFFQERFFPVSPEDKVTVFADVDAYGDGLTNDAWYKLAYGGAALARIAGRQAICVGTVLGTQEATVRLLKEFTNFIARSPFGRIEQAIFNHMLHTDLFRTKPQVAPNISNSVANLASKSAHDSVVILDGQLCRTIDNSVIPIVHMYDRWPEIDQLCKRKYASCDSAQS